MYVLKIPAGDKINPESTRSPSTPDPQEQEPPSLSGSFHLNVEACDRNLEVVLCLSKTQKWPASTYKAEAF